MQPNHWYSLPIGTSEAHMQLIRFSRANAVFAELYISNNKSIFDQLCAQKNEIEKETGVKFDWYRLNDKKASVVRTNENFTFQNGNDSSEGFGWLMNAAMRMKTAFVKYM